MSNIVNLLYIYDFNKYRIIKIKIRSRVINDFKGY